MEQFTLRGVVHGNSIELNQDSGLPDGQQVTVIVQPLNEPLSPGEGLKRSFGVCAEDAQSIDEFLAWNRQQRKAGRSGIEP